VRHVYTAAINELYLVQISGLWGSFLLLHTALPSTLTRCSLLKSHCYRTGAFSNSHFARAVNTWSEPNQNKKKEKESIARAERDGTRAETRFRLSPKQTSPFKSAGASVQSTAGSRGVRISGSNAGYTTFRGKVELY
jgi:hypothetical protein